MPADAHHHSSVHQVIELYRFGDELLAKALHGLSREDLLHRAGPTSNPLIWMAGHIAVMRFRIANILGQPEEVPMENLFGGPSKAEDAAAYPHLPAVRELHHQATERLFSRLRAATPEMLSGPAPSSGKSVGETVNLLTLHEGMHIGQMFFLRKLLGHPATEPLMD